MNYAEWKNRLAGIDRSRFKQSGQWEGKTVADYARIRAEEHPDRTAAVDGDLRISYGELWREACRVAAGLRDLGLQRGDVISFQLPNWWETVVINLAASMGGWAVNPIVPIYRDAEVGFILRDCDAKVVFVPERFRSIDYVEMMGRLKEADPTLGTRLITVRGTSADHAGGLTYEKLGRGMAPWSGVDPDADDLKLILYTSGTTGRPKGVLHSSNTLAAELKAVVDFWRIGTDDVVIMPSPVTHITGYSYALEFVFYAGIKIVLMDRWDAKAAVDLIATEGATFTVAATPFLAELTAFVESSNVQLPRFRLFASGGAPVPPDLVRRAASALSSCLVCRVYGSSETPTVSLGINRAEDAQLGATTDGKIWNNDVRVVDPVTGEVVATGQEGEITVMGPEIMIGYLREDDNRSAFTPDGYFMTGDLGTVSDDGFITITGRKKDLIIRGGENLSPKEVEDILHSHPDVLEAAVVAMPHERLGETPCAYVVLKPGASMDLEGMGSFLESKRLARQKIPEKLIVRDALPKTASGKVLKHVLRREIATPAVTGEAVRS